LRAGWFGYLKVAVKREVEIEVVTVEVRDEVNASVQAKLTFPQVTVSLLVCTTKFLPWT
jgi:hypothetical protein